MGSDRRTDNWLRVAVYATLTCFCLLLLQGRSAFGQVDEGAITGTVVDSTGAVIPNATVTLINTDQGITLETRSNGTGGYTFSPVKQGNYTITVTAQGFSKTTQKNVHVDVAQTLQVNISLKLGAATETVEVNTAPPLLQTEEASVGQVIGAQEVNALPLNGATSHSWPNWAPECRHRRPTRVAMRHRELSRPTAFVRHRITICSMASTTTQMRSIF